jgi:hypothetical protein
MKLTESELISLIENVLKKSMNSGDKNPLSKVEITMFKYLNDNKKTLGTQDGLLKFIKRFLPLVGINPNMDRFYYEIYTQNFRPKGDYENITYDNFKNVRELKTKKIPNTQSFEYVASKIPFKGSNIEGFWSYNSKNQWYYLVESYGWYPVYLYINDKWFEISDKYSSTTRKQMSQSNPYRFSQDVNDKIYSVSKKEMDKLIAGEDLVDIVKDRTDYFVTNSKFFYPSQINTMTVGKWNNRKRVTFKIEKISKNRNKVKFVISLTKADRIVNRKLSNNPEEFITDLNFYEEIKNDIQNRIINDNDKYLSHDNTIFEFK